MSHTKASHQAARVPAALAARRMRLPAAPYTFAACVLVACSSPTDPPASNEPASVTVQPPSARLISLGDTLELEAVVRNHASQAIAAAVTWSVTPQGVVSVDAHGTIVTLDNGTATVSATAGGVSGTTSVTVEQMVDSLAVAGDLQGGALSFPLDSAVEVTLRDARGHLIVGAPVSFGIVSGGGSVDPASTVTDAAGKASATWTLGSEMGTQELDATAGFREEGIHRFSTSALALEPASIVMFDGDAQSELTSKALPAPLRVQVLDPAGNAVPDVLVEFVVDGDAVLESFEVYTDLDGVAAVQLVLGAALGTYTVQASVPDSLVRSGEPLNGSPVSMTAEAVTFVVDALPPLTAGEAVTISGTGFHPTPDSNTIMIGGVRAAILAGSQSALTIEVPAFGCTPQRMLGATISRAGEHAMQSAVWTPANAIVLEVGERRTLSGADASCMQFLPGADEEYLVGLTATGRLHARSTFSMVGVDAEGFVAGAATPSARIARRTGSTIAGLANARDPELRLRAYEETLVTRLRGSAIAAPGRTGTSTRAARAYAVTAAVVGEDLTLRLPDLRGDPCLDYVPVTARVFSVGERLVLASAVPLPAPTSPLYAALVTAANALQAEFGDTAVDRVVSFLGASADWSADSRVTIVLAPDVAAMGLPAYASAVDQFQRTACPSSNEGQYVYVAVPQAATTAQLVARLAELPPEATHHIAHIVQWARRLAIGNRLLPAWIAEGQAELLVEHVGLALSGLGSQQDLGADVLAAPKLGAWIPGRFDRLARFNGWNGASGKVPGAPEGCSLFGFAELDSPCDPSAAPGAAWSFLRYVSDRFGPGRPGGEPALHAAILALDPASELLPQFETLLGVGVPELIVDWAATLYTDGRLATPALQLTSWRLDELLLSDARRLTPQRFDFGGFTRSGTIVGGGSAYSLITSSGSHGALAVLVGDGAGGAIASVMGPRLWVVRMR